MQRRSILQAAAGLTLLAAPRIGRPDTLKILRFVPSPGLVVLDPIFTTARSTRTHGYLVFDTL